MSYHQKCIYFEDNICLHSGRPIEQIFTHNTMLYVFNLGLITPLNTSLPIFFPHFYVFIIHEYANVIIFI